MNQRHLSNAGIFLFLVILIVAGRYFPHAANFTPAAAAGLFAGFWFRNRFTAVAVPLVGMLLSDLLIQQSYPWTTMAIVYVAMAVPALLGTALFKGNNAGFLKKAGKVTLGAVAGSVLFFVSTNFAVWMFDGIYAKNAAGFAACFAAAVPFFRFTLAGDLFFAFSLFGGYALVSSIVASRKANVAGL
ncbi:MAG: hypothetical protein IPN95_05085 [Bacteroidetes bacterium]|nr:hypothetical protein [Bacteroidota bacterium]MBP6640795.1 hypothetical protein [Bacteroidia bacterium]MBP6721028.1 hypothetical protein [Bacteroidia bacterium]MBP8073896.1 hypothetical protein [Bacteroidia bacterium]